MAGVRIFDVSNPEAPKLIKNVQTCKGSHTHTIVPEPEGQGRHLPLRVGQPGRAAGRRSWPGARTATDPADATNSLFRLDVIKVPLEHPEQAAVMPGARIFTGLDAGAASASRCCAPAATRRPRRPRWTRRGATRRRRRTAADRPAQLPRRDGVSGDAPARRRMRELRPARRHLEPREAGASRRRGRHELLALAHRRVQQRRHEDHVHRRVGRRHGADVPGDEHDGDGRQHDPHHRRRSKKYTQHAYFKIPSAQSAQENCVSHNGGLIPVPGRDLMVQGWYQGGVDVIDFTDPDHPYELAYFDRGPIDPPPPPTRPARPPSARGGRGARGTIGGSWGAYYWNGYDLLVGARPRLRHLELTPSDQLSANEIAAAKLVRLNEYNPQSQPKIVWPAAFPVVRSYLDQLVRNNGLAAARTTAIASALDAAEKQRGAARGASLTKLAAQVDGDVERREGLRRACRRCRRRSSVSRRCRSSRRPRAGAIRRQSRVSHGNREGPHNFVWAFAFFGAGWPPFNAPSRQ